MPALTRLIKIAPALFFAAYFCLGLAPGNGYCNLKIRWGGAAWGTQCVGSCNNGKVCEVTVGTGPNHTAWQCGCCAPPPPPETNCVPPNDTLCHATLIQFVDIGWVIDCIDQGCPTELCRRRTEEFLGDPDGNGEPGGPPWPEDEWIQACYCWLIE